MRDPARRTERLGSRRLRGYLLVFFAAACWAVGGLAAKWLFTAPGPATVSWPVPPLGVSVDPLELAAARAFAAAVILGVALAVLRPRSLKIPAGELPLLAVFGVVGLAGVHFAYFKAISLTNVATAILLEYLAPVLVLIVGVIFLGERPTWRLPAGVLLSVTGCALVVGAIGGGGLLVTPAGIAWGLVAAVLFASYSMMGDSIARRLDAYTALFGGLVFASLFWLIVLGPPRLLGLFADPPLALAIGGIAIVSTILPFSAFLAALRFVRPTNALVTSTIEPVIAGLGAFALFGEDLMTSQLLGGALVLAAIVLVQAPGRSDVSVLPPPD